MYYKLKWVKDNLDFTGHYLGIDFKDGIGMTKYHFYYNALRHRFCEDVSPQEMIIARSERDLKKILVVRVGAYGDLMMITPALRGLREKYPKAQIDFVGRHPNDEILKYNPHINQVLPNVRMSDIGLLCPNYDEVYDLSHSIELNPESDYRSAQEIACEWLQVKPESYEPIIGATKKELNDAYAMLYRNGIDIPKWKGRIIMMHTESSSFLRRLPDVTALTVAQHYAELGYKVVFNGINTELKKNKLVSMPCCGGLRTAIVDSHFSGITLPCNKCEQKDVTPKIIELNENIHFLQHEGQEAQRRIKFLTVAYADLLIGVDSSLSHIAAAFQKPSVLIYGPFDASLRAAHWPNAYCIQMQPACGPCHQLAPWCIRYQNNIPPCIKEIQPQQIINAVDMHLGLNGQTFTGNNSMDFAFDPRQLNRFRDCPVCNSDTSTIMARKKDFLYRKCMQCKTLFTHKEQSHLETGPVYVNDFLDQSAELVYSCWAPKIYDLVKKNIHPSKNKISIAELSSANNYFIRALSKIDSSCAFEYKDQVEWDAVVAIRALETFVKPRLILEEIYKNLCPGGYFMSYGPAANAWNRNNAWIHINTQTAGHNKTIFSTDSIQYLAKEVGFEIAEYKPFTQVEEHLILLRKPKDDKISK